MEANPPNDRNSGDGEQAVQQIGRFRFENVEHTADRAIIAYGDTYQQMLECAAAAMFAQQADLSTVRRSRSWHVVAEADSAEDLLVAWLREVLLLAEESEAVMCDFRISSFREWRVEAQVWGAPISDSVMRTGAAVKAVTYHNLSVRKGLLWRGSVTFDV